MNRKLILIFVSFALATLLILNGRFLWANLRFSFSREFPVVDKDNLRPSPGVERLLTNKRAVDTELFDRLGAAVILVIPKIGVKAPIILPSANEKQDIYKSLEQGVVNYSLTVKPGENGTAVILGHSSALPWYRGKYGSVFALLSKLEVGDSFYVQYRNGTTFNYLIKKTLVFSPLNQDRNLSSLAESQKPSVILVSCWPIDVPSKRVAVKAELLLD